MKAIFFADNYKVKLRYQIKISLLLSLVCAVFHSTQAQPEERYSIKERPQFILGIEQGLVLNLVDDKSKTAVVNPVVDANHYMGIQANLTHLNWCFSLALTRNGYWAGSQYDDKTLREHKLGGYAGSSQFAGDYTVYQHRTLKFGYNRTLKPQRLYLQPFVGFGWLRTAYDGTTFTSRDTSRYTYPGDTISIIRSIAMVRPLKNALTYGAGIKLIYHLRKFYFAANFEYFQSNKIWTLTRSTYLRTSTVHGVLAEERVFKSRARTAVAGFTFGYRF
jgi:hypothetical protein